MKSIPAKQGFFAHDAHAIYDTHLSLVGDFTADGFEHAFTGKGAKGQGLLPRCSLKYGPWETLNGDWFPRNPKHEQQIVTRMGQAVSNLPTHRNRVFVPPEDSDAREIRLAFFKELMSQAAEYLALEVMSLFKRDLLLRVVFSDHQVITLPETERSIAWAKNQLNVRRTLWPEDIGSFTEQMERKITRPLKEKGRLSDNDLMKACGVFSHPGSGVSRSITAPGVRCSGPQSSPRPARTVKAGHSGYPLSKIDPNR